MSENNQGGESRKTPGMEYLKNRGTPLEQHPNYPNASNNERVEWQEFEKGKPVGPANERAPHPGQPERKG